MALVIAAGIYPPEIGGVASAVADAVQDLLRAKKRIQVVTYGGAQTTVEERGGLTLTRVSRRGPALVRYLRYAAYLRRALHTGDSLWATDLSSTGIPARLAVIGTGARLFFRLGGERSWEDAVYQKRVFCSLRDYWRFSKGGVLQWIARIQYRFVLGRAEQLILVSTLLRECLLEIEPRWQNKMVVVPTRVSVPPLPRKEKLYRPFRLLCVGRMTAIKNLPFLARVLARLSQTGRAFTIAFVGEGEERSLVESALGTRVSVQFFPSESREQLFQRMATHDLLLLPSITDIYPHTVIESLSQGTPVLMTTEHGLEEGFGGVMYASPQEEGAWEAALTRLFDDPMAYEYLRASIRIPDRQVPSWSERLLPLC